MSPRNMISKAYQLLKSFFLFLISFSEWAAKNLLHLGSVLVWMLKYTWGSFTKNFWNVIRFGLDNRSARNLGPVIVGGLIGSVGFPVGTLLGIVVGGIVVMTLNYGRSQL